MNNKSNDNTAVHFMMSKELKQRISLYAKKNSLSISSAICLLCNKSLEAENALLILNEIMNDKELKKVLKKELKKDISDNCKTD